MQHAMAIRADESDVRNFGHRTRLEVPDGRDMVCFNKASTNLAVDILKVESTTLAHIPAMILKKLCLGCPYYVGIPLPGSMLQVVFAPFRKTYLIIFFR